MITFLTHWRGRIRCRSDLNIGVFYSKIAFVRKKLWYLELSVLFKEFDIRIDRSAHIYFSAEVNPPCPNAVIEALACGIPVLGFDTGSLSELVPPAAGKTVPYGADVWKLESPDISSLTEAALEILTNLPQYQQSARQHAEENLGLDLMVEKYLNFFTTP